MKLTQIIGAILIIGGIIGVALGGFSYTKETEAVKLGPLALNVTEKKDVNIPLWASIIAIVAGGGLLFLSKKN
jgi:hypothetical protein